MSEYHDCGLKQQAAVDLNEAWSHACLLTTGAQHFPQQENYAALTVAANVRFD